MKELKSLIGAKMLSKKEQKELKGGYVDASCADLHLDHLDYESCMLQAPLNCRDYCEYRMTL